MVAAITSEARGKAVTGLDSSAADGNIAVLLEGGNLTLDEQVKAGAGQVSLAATLGSISGAGLITAGDLVLEAGTSIGTSAALLQLDVAQVAARADAGGIYLQDTDATANGLTVAAITSEASGTAVTGLDSSAADGNIAVLLEGGNLTLDEQVKAGAGQVSLAATLGSISGAGLITAGDLVLEAGTSIGTSAALLQLDVAQVAARADAGGIYLQDTDATANGLTVAAITSEASGTAVTGLDSSAADGNIAVLLEGGNLTLDEQVKAGAGQVSLAATLGSISGAGLITAGDLVLEAGTSIGTSAALLQLDVAQVAARADAGGIYLQDTDATANGLTVAAITSEASGTAVTGLDSSAADGNIAVLLEGGNLTLDEQVKAGAGQVSLAAMLGSISGAGLITPAYPTRRSSDLIGTSAALLQLDVAQVAARADAGGIYLQDTDATANG